MLATVFSPHLAHRGQRVGAMFLHSITSHSYGKVHKYVMKESRIQTNTHKYTNASQTEQQECTW